MRTKLEIIFLRETMCVTEIVKGVLLSLFPRWDFVVNDAKGRSGGVATRWCLASCSLRNTWGCDSCIGIDIYSHDLSVEFFLFNVYGSYLNWDSSHPH